MRWLTHIRNAELWQGINFILGEQVRVLLKTFLPAQTSFAVFAQLAMGLAPSHRFQINGFGIAQDIDAVFASLFFSAFIKNRKSTANIFFA